MKKNSAMCSHVLVSWYLNFTWPSQPINIFLDSFFFAVVGEEGLNSDLAKDVELIKLFTRDTCPKPPNLPGHQISGIIATYLNDELIVCYFISNKISESRLESISNCYEMDFNDWYWKQLPFALSEERAYSANAKYSSGNDSSSQTWLILGGQRFTDGSPEILDSSEILEDNKFSYGPILPIPLSGHCAVSINDTHIFIAGGYNPPYHFKSSYILDMSIGKEDFEPVADMIHGRYGHSCGKVFTIFKKVKLVAAGGLKLESVELFSMDTGVWKMGHSLPNPIFRAATVQV